MTVLREMRWWDLEGVLALEAELFPDDAWPAATYWAELARARGPERNRAYLVAEEPGGRLVGYGGLGVAGGTGDVMTLGVTRDRQGGGLGARLLAALLDAARGLGCHEVLLEVRVDNLPAQRLYKRFGFARIGIRRGYYQPGNRDALVLRRDLAVGGPDAGPAPSPPRDAPTPDAPTNGAPETEPPSIRNAPDGPASPGPAAAGPARGANSPGGGAPAGNALGGPAPGVNALGGAASPGSAAAGPASGANAPDAFPGAAAPGVPRGERPESSGRPGGEPRGGEPCGGEPYPHSDRPGAKPGSRSGGTVHG